MPVIVPTSPWAADGIALAAEAEAGEEDDDEEVEEEDGGEVSPERGFICVVHEMTRRTVAANIRAQANFFTRSPFGSAIGSLAGI